MTAFRAFDDERLDANLAAILRLPDAPIPSDPAAGAAVAPLRRVHGSRRASVNVALALGLALCGAVVAMLAGRTDTVTGHPDTDGRDVRQVIPLSGTTVIRQPSDPVSASTATIDTAATGTAPAGTVTTARPRRTSVPPSMRVAATRAQPVAAPEPSPSPADASPAPAKAPAAPAGTNVAAVDTKTVTRADAPRPLPVATPDPAPSSATPADAASVKQDRRDSVDAIRGLRRQF